MVVLSIFCLSCGGQNIQNTKKKNTKEVLSIDTLSVLPLTNKQYGSSHYKILRLCNLDSEGYQIVSTKRIELSEGNKTVASISLPVPDEEVKNFSVTKVAETKHGFKIAINWGGGNYIYDIEFYFAFRGHQFYLESIITNNYGPDKKGVRITKRISPPAPIDEFNMLYYINNE